MGWHMWTKLRKWWYEDEGKVLNLVIPLFIKKRLKWFSVLNKMNPIIHRDHGITYITDYFFSVYEGEKESYKAYKNKNTINRDNEVGFTINQELKKMALQIIHTRNLAEEEEKEKEREKKERENEKKERENEKSERKKILDTLELMQRNQNCRVSEGSN